MAMGVLQKRWTGKNKGKTWMIWAYPYFRKPPFLPLFTVIIPIYIYIYNVECKFPTASRELHLNAKRTRLFYLSQKSVRETIASMYKRLDTDMSAWRGAYGGKACHTSTPPSCRSCWLYLQFRAWRRVPCDCEA